MNTDDLVTMLATGPQRGIANAPNLSLRRQRSVGRALARHCSWPSCWVCVTTSRTPCRGRCSGSSSATSCRSPPQVCLRSRAFQARRRRRRGGVRPGCSRSADVADRCDPIDSGGFRRVERSRLRKNLGVLPGLIATLSVPTFAAMAWATKGFAPTRLRLAGAAMGLASGGVAAAVYSLHCPEMAAPFLVCGILGAS